MLYATVTVQVKQEKKLKQSILSGINRASGGDVSSAAQQMFNVCITLPYFTFRRSGIS